MDMKPDEIVVRYRQAKHKAEQIKILADLNACSVDDIIRVLVNHGDYTPRSLNKVRGDAKKLPKMAEPVEEPQAPEETTEEVQQAEPVQTEPEPTIKPIETPIDNALSVIKKQIDEINVEISALNRRKQAIIDKLRDIFTDGTEQ